jgi:hypothetical protein
MSLNLHSRDRGSDPVDDYIDVLFGVKAGRLDDHAGSAHDRPQTDRETLTRVKIGRDGLPRVDGDGPIVLARGDLM